MADTPLKYEPIELTGRLITSVDPTQLGKGDFQSLSNMRYTNASVKSIRGISKINTSAITEPVPGAAIHFQKDFPSESHLLVQGIAANGSSSAIYDNTTAAPTQANFSDIHTLTGTTEGRFSLAPDGGVIFGNGTDLILWGGAEARCAGFIISDTDGTTTSERLWDFTNDVIDSDATTVAVFRDRYLHVASTRKLRGVKLYVSTANTTCTGTVSGYYWNGDDWTALGNLVDGTASGGKSLVQTGSITFDSTVDTAKLRYLNNTLAFWYLFDFAGSNIVTNGTFTTDLTGWAGANWAFSSGTALHSAGATTALTQAAAVVIAGVRYKLSYDITGRSAGSVTPSAGSSSGTTRSANATGIVDFLDASDTTALKFTPTTDFDGAIDNVVLIPVSSNAEIKQCTVNAAWQKPTDLWDGVPREIVAFQVYRPATASYEDYSTRVFSKDYVDGAIGTYIEFDNGVIDLIAGFTERMTGITFSVVPEYKNTTSNTLSVAYWSGSDWVPLTIQDGTLSDGKSLRQSGTIFWTAPEDSKETKTSVSSPDLFYYYKVTLGTSLAAGFSSSAVRCGASYGGKSTLEITATAHGLSEGDYVRISGATPDSMNVTMARVYSGNNFGTMDPNWFRVVIDGEVGLGVVATVQPTIEKYDSTATMGTDIRFDYVSGIPAEKRIDPYKFGAMFQNRLCLCNNQSSQSNTMLIGGANTSCVFNGSDSTTVFFGDDRELTASVPFFSRFSNNYFENMVVFKTDSVWIIDGDSPETYRARKISPINGCAAPGTLTSCDIGFAGDSGAGARNILLWQSASGICMFEGSVIIPVHGDISDVFDPTKSYSIEPAMVKESQAFYDEENKEWHWLWASKGSTTLDKEYVLDVLRLKWYTVDRGSGNRFQLGVSVTGSNNIRYAYGITSDGYVKRIENGQTFDGTAITSSYKTGDVPLGGWMKLTSIRRIKPIIISKSTTTNTMSLSYFGDSSTIAIKTLSFNVNDSTHRIAQTQTNKPNVESLNEGDFVFHSFQCSMTTNNEDVGFEPIGIGILYKETREDLK